MLYARKEGNAVNCLLCSHRCIIQDGNKGICGVRENNKGVLYSLVYGKAIAAHIDPIEKKPLNHYLPGTMSYSIATAGCNLRCKFCQNWSISQGPKEQGMIKGENITPEEVVDNAINSNCKSIAYTYTEPTVFFEYAYDCGKLAREKNIGNVFVSNGFMTGETLDNAKEFLDAANIDLKSFTDEFYREMCGARLEPVLESIKKMKNQGVWVEITTLVIPERNDSDEELRNIAEYIANEVGTETPWHVSRFHPDNKYTDSYSTPAETLHRAREIGEEAGLKYVYVGNIPGDRGEHTFCPRCKQLLINRDGFHVSGNKIRDGKCPECNTKIDGVWE